MAKDLRILFNPFEGTSQDHFNAKCESWKKSYEKLHGLSKTQVEVVKYSGQKQNIVSNSWGVGDQIYVMGHGSAGSDTTTPGSPGPDYPNGITYSQLIDRLITTGLKKHFCGSIKLYL